MLIQLLGKKTEDAVLDSKTGTENGVYSATDYGIDGFDVFTVAVPEPSGTLSIDENGIKDVKDYARVDVNVSAAAPVIQPLSVTPDVYSQTYPIGSDIDGYGPVNVAAVTSAIDSNIVASNIVSGVSILGVAGSAVVANETTLSVTPSTSSQTMTPSSPYTGFNSVTVDAVDSSIDANIVAGNIKSGVTILGVAGNVAELNGEQITITPSVSSQTIVPESPYNAITVAYVDPVTSAIDSNIVASNIKSGVSILGVAGSVVELNASTETVTPTTSQQVITPTNPSNGFTEVTVNAVTSAIDANIVASNIKSGVTILGVTGNYSGGTAPYCVEKSKDVNNKLVSGGASIIDLSGATDIGDYVLAYAYLNNHAISGLVDFSSLTAITGTMACHETFKNCTGLTGVDLSSVVTIGAEQACSSMFNSCWAMTSADLSSLAAISGGEGCWAMFINCTSLASVLLSSLSSITGARACRRMFANTALTSLSFPALTSNSFGSYTNQFNEMLLSVTGCTVHFPSNLQSVIGSWQDVIDGFGGTNTTVLFDLPATE